LRREDFNHVIAAAAAVSGERVFVVIGSQAVLGSVEQPPESMLASMEADIYPRDDPAKAAEIDANLGDGSQFQSTYGYYAHGVGPETAKAPAGWMERLVSVEVPPRVHQKQAAVALCLELHDLILAKCAAGRGRDWDYAEEALAAGLVDLDQLMSRIADLPIDDPAQRRVRAMLAGIARKLDIGEPD
jgi:hypothetical protein